MFASKTQRSHVQLKYLFSMSSLWFFLGTDHAHRPPLSAELQPMSQLALPQLVRIHASASCPRPGLGQDCWLATCGNLNVRQATSRMVRTVGWPHVRTDELGCLTAQMLDSCVTSMHDVLVHCLAGRQTLHSNAADRWYSSSCVSNTSR